MSEQKTFHGRFYELNSVKIWDEIITSDFFCRIEKEDLLFEIEIINKEKNIEKNIFKITSNTDVSLQKKERAFTWKEEEKEYAICFHDFEEYERFTEFIAKYLPEDEDIEYGLPETISVNKLDMIDEIIKEAVDNINLRNIILIEIQTLLYIPQLFSFFKTNIEEDKKIIQKLNSIFKNLFLLNSLQITSTLLSEKYVFDFVEIVGGNKNIEDGKEHQTNIAKRTKFVFQNKKITQSLLNIIQDTLRIQYIKENLEIARQTIQTTQILILLLKRNYQSIIYTIDGDKKVMAELIALFSEKNDPEQTFLFFKEMFSFNKTNFGLTKPNFLKLETIKQLMEMLKKSIIEEKDKHLSSVLEIINILSHNDVHILRDYIVTEDILPETEKTINILFNRLVSTDSLSLITQLITTFKLLLDTFNEKKAKENFLNTFYPHYVSFIFEPIEELPANVLIDERGSLLITEKQEEIFSGLLDLLSIIIQNHSFRAKNFIIRGTILQKTLLLLKSWKKHLRMSVVRVLKEILNTKDEFYFRKLCETDTFKVIFESFLEDGLNDNAFTSSCLSFFVIINDLSSETLPLFLIKKHKDLMEGEFKSFSIFTRIIERNGKKKIKSEDIWCCLDKEDLGSDSKEELDSF